MYSKKPLESYQIEGYERAKKHDGFALFFKQGTGKTATAIQIVGYQISRGLRKILIVAPANVLDTWIEQYDLFANYKYKIVKFDDIGRPLEAEFLGTRRNPSVLNSPLIILISYDLLRRRVPLLLKWKPEVVIADESHSIKNRRAKQSRALWKLGDKARYRLILTGTPIDESGLDVWSQYRFACPEVFGKKWREFAEYYGRNIGFGYQKWIVRRAMEDELKEKIHSRMFRVEKDVLDLPRLRHIKSFVKLEPNIQELYKQLEKNAVASINQRTAFTPVVVTKVLRLQQLTGGFFVDDTKQSFRASFAKTRRLKKILSSMTGKTVVFCRFLNEIEAAANTCKDLGLEAIVYTGRTKKKVRYELRKTFELNPKARVFISQIRTGGVGVNELKVAKTVIFYSTSYSWIDFDQALNRVHRRGQKNEVTCYHILAKGTVDTDIYDIVRSKKHKSQVLLSIMNRGELLEH